MAFENLLRIRLPTYLYRGMPPSRAEPGSIIREPKTASQWLRLEGGDEVLDDLGRVLAVAVEQDHDVEVVLDGPLVGRLLVAAVAEVLGPADDRQRKVGLGCWYSVPDRVGAVAAGVVADDDLGDPCAGSSRAGGQAPMPASTPRCRRRRPRRS